WFTSTPWKLMLPAGIISSGGLEALIAGGVAAGVVAGGTSGAEGVPGVGKPDGRAGAGGVLVPMPGRGGKRRGLGIGCAHDSSTVKNKIRTSVVVFILQFWLKAWNCPARQPGPAPPGFFDSW